MSAPSLSGGVPSARVERVAGRIVAAAQGGGGDSLGYGPNDFTASAVITGEDWVDDYWANPGTTLDISDIESWGFFYHEGGSLPVTGYIDLQSDALFGTALRMHQTNTNWSVKGGRNFDNARSKNGATWVYPNYGIYSAVMRFSPNWGEGNWKMMFGYWTDGGGTQRIEAGSVVQGSDFYIIPGAGTPAQWTNGVEVLNDGPVHVDAFGDWWQFVMVVRVIGSGAGEARVGWAGRRLTTDGGATLNPQSWNGWTNHYDNDGTLDNLDSWNGISLGNTKNDQPTETYYVYYGPWVVLDMEDANAPTDPWGLLSHLGL